MLSIAVTTQAESFIQHKENSQHTTHNVTSTNPPSRGTAVVRWKVSKKNVMQTWLPTQSYTAPTIRLIVDLVQQCAETADCQGAAQQHDKHCNLLLGRQLGEATTSEQHER
jgi:hypothetical protein